MLPARIIRNSGRQEQGKRSPAHRAWVRGHECIVSGCHARPIECMHVRSGCGGGIGVKPSDRWCVSGCAAHHREQHMIGEPAFEQRHGVNLRELAGEFARRSPHWPKLKDMA